MLFIHVLLLIREYSNLTFRALFLKIQAFLLMLFEFLSNDHFPAQLRAISFSILTFLLVCKCFFVLEAKWQEIDLIRYFHVLNLLGFLILTIRHWAEEPVLLQYLFHKSMDRLELNTLLTTRWARCIWRTPGFNAITAKRHLTLRAFLRIIQNLAANCTYKMAAALFILTTWAAELFIQR